MSCFNPKITFRFIEYLFQCRPINESGRVLKKIYKNELEPSTDFQRLFVIAINDYNYLYNKQLNVDDIINLSKLFPTHDLVLNNDQLQQLNSLILLVQNSGTSLADIAGIFSQTIRLSFINEYKIELAKLLCNYPLITNGEPPIIMYETYTAQAVNLINSNAPQKDIEEVFLLMKERTDRYNNAHEDISLETVKKTLFKNQQILRNHYGVNHLYIYGSYSRNEQTIYSDLDLLIVPTSSSYYNISKKRISDFIQNEAKLPCDVSIKNHTFNGNHNPGDIFDGALRIF